MGLLNTFVTFSIRYMRQSGVIRRDRGIFSSSAPSLLDFVVPAVEMKESLMQGECRDVL